MWVGHESSTSPNGSPAKAACAQDKDLRNAGSSIHPEPVDRTGVLGTQPLRAFPIQLVVPLSTEMASNLAPDMQIVLTNMMFAFSFPFATAGAFLVPFIAITFPVPEQPFTPSHTS
jgi:hypothetical protein